MNPKRPWWNSVREAAIDPGRPIVDPHHHLWKASRWGSYLLDDLRADTAGGHNVEQTVFVECDSEYRTSGPREMQPLGETEFVAAAAAEPTAGGRICAIVAHADLTLGARVEEVLAGHARAGRGLVRGIRHRAAWDPSDALRGGRRGPGPGLYANAAFREGFARLAELGLSFDAWNFHPQIPELTDLARAYPATTIIANHLGGPLGIGPYKGKTVEVLGAWSRDLSALARCPNVVLKVGGLGMRICGHGWAGRSTPATSDELAEAYRPWFAHALAAFGPDRCMFESNYPVDGESAGYVVIWNAFKKLSADLPEPARDALFRGTAARVYRI
jgi:predicted TIM-barrel fold metal-dependent hydrolase